MSRTVIGLVLGSIFSLKYKEEVVFYPSQLPKLAMAENRKLFFNFVFE